MLIPKGPGRHPVKRDQIVNYIKDKIIDASWLPGERITSRAKLEKKFSASSVTIQCAFDLLLKDKFLRVEGRKGTFVNGNLPHLNNYALVFPDFPGDIAHRNSYLERIDAQAAKLNKSIPGNIISYYGIKRAQTQADFVRLLTDIKERRLAGIIFTTTPFLLENTPVLDTKIPKVAVMSDDRYPNIPQIHMNMRSFIDKSIDYLLSRGKKRIAILDTPGFSAHHSSYFFKRFEAVGAIHFPEWHQLVYQKTPECAENIIRLMMAEFNVKKPDGIIITDDNLAPYVQAGLKASSVPVPEKLEIVALANIPTNIPQDPPVKLIGFSALEILQTGLNLIDRIRSCLEVPDQTIMEAQFGN